jgi:small subunit ribosomal protein S2
MQEITHKQLLEAGVHFGHLKKKWNPKMLPYIFMEKKGIHIIDLYKTHDKLQEAAQALKSIARSGKKILFVATKKQGKEIVQQAAKRANMPFVTERWLGGMLTNFATIRKSIKKMQQIEKMLADNTLENITKKEKLVLSREKDKLEKVLGGIAQLNRMPAAIFVVDILHEHIAISEAKKLNVSTFAMVDTNSDPTSVDFAVPANDDASKSIEIITNFLTEAIIEGLQERKTDKDEMDASRGEDGEELPDNLLRERKYSGEEGGTRTGGEGNNAGGDKKKGGAGGPGRSKRPVSAKKR